MPQNQIIHQTQTEHSLLNATCPHCFDYANSSNLGLNTLSDQVTQTQTVEVAGIPRIEFRTSQPVKTEVCVCFTPSYEDSDFAYTAPKFVWGAEVAIASEWETLKGTELATELSFYRIRAIELVEPVVKIRGKEYLSDAPYYLYGIRDSRIQGNIRWFMEEELIHKRELEAEIELF